MSSIYIREPPTSGKVILTTTVGEIEVELWAKECPLACRNFVQLCMEGYYDDTAFHRLIKNFIVQGGDPTGSGEGGESIYGAPFKTEVHSRLSFNRRGLLGMACAAKDQNNSQFFFTLGPAEELNGKHTLFGRCAGNTIFNMLRLGEGEVGKRAKPLNLRRIVSAEVVVNPFDDIEPRQTKRPAEAEQKPREPAGKATKKFGLLSFGDEAEEEENTVSKVSETLRKRGKSAHDLANNKRLSRTALPLELDEEMQRAAEQFALESEEFKRRCLEDSAAKETHRSSKYVSSEELERLREEAEEQRRAIARTKQAERRRVGEREEAERAKERREAEQAEEERQAAARSEADSKKGLDDLDDFSGQLAGYKVRARRQREARDREANTLDLLGRFRDQLAAPKQWMRTKLSAEQEAPEKTRVLDPSMEHPDRYDLYDPRNPLNVRKRAE